MPYEKGHRARYAMRSDGTTRYVANIVVAYKVWHTSDWVAAVKNLYDNYLSLLGLDRFLWHYSPIFQPDQMGFASFDKTAKSNQIKINCWCTIINVGYDAIKQHRNVYFSTFHQKFKYALFICLPNEWFIVNILRRWCKCIQHRLNHWLVIIHARYIGTLCICIESILVNERALWKDFKAQCMKCHIYGHIKSKHSEMASIKQLINQCHANEKISASAQDHQNEPIDAYLVRILDLGFILRYFFTMIKATKTLLHKCHNLFGIAKTLGKNSIAMRKFIRFILPILMVILKSCVSLDKWVVALSCAKKINKRINNYITIRDNSNLMWRCQIKTK